MTEGLLDWSISEADRWVENDLLIEWREESRHDLSIKRGWVLVPQRFERVEVVEDGGRRQAGSYEVRVPCI